MISATSCCGVRDFMGLRNNPEETLRYFCDERRGRDGAFYMFTGTDGSCISDLANYIRENELGTLTETEFVRNPNSAHQLKALMVSFNREALNTWYSTRMIAPPSIHTNTINNCAGGYGRGYQFEPYAPPRVMWYLPDNNRQTDAFFVVISSAITFCVALLIPDIVQYVMSWWG